MRAVGSAVQRIDAVDKVTGKALYPADFSDPDQLHMKVLFARRPHAKINAVDIEDAQKVEGVVLILTAKDVPNNEYGLIEFDQPVLCGPGSNKPFADRVRFIGDQVAVVIAETEAIAAEARAKIKVDYEDLPLTLNPHEARKEGAYKIHPDRDSNIVVARKIRKGDIDVGFAEADVIIEHIYETPEQEHVYLQPEAGISYIDEEGRVTVVVAGQWAHEDRDQIAHALNLPEDRVRVIYPAIGGAFGGREDMSIQIILGLAAIKLAELGINRKVKVEWTREESIIGHCKRHRYTIKSKWGATYEGKIIAAEIELVADAGAYLYTSGKVLGNALLACTGPYEIPNVKVDGFAVYTNNLPGGAFRGFGGPQGTFSSEMQMNKLAEALGMDPVELRSRNVLKEGSMLSFSSPILEGVSIGKVVAECALASGWQRDGKSWRRIDDYQVEVPGKPHLRRGIGFACGIKNVGFSYGAPESCWAEVEIQGEEDIQDVIVRHAGAEVGQGTHTVYVQVAANALQIPVDLVRLQASDTSFTGNAGSVSASRMSFMASNAIKGAAEAALEKWQDEERPAVGTYVYHPPRTTQMDPVDGSCVPNFAYGYVAEFVELEVDIETGMVRVIDVLCADDVGKAINPIMIEGQIEGGIVQAAGYAILENFIHKDGFVLTDTLSTYLIPTVLDIPDQVQSLILEYPDPQGAWGIRGMGEMMYLPFTPAVAAALRMAIGEWVDRFPYTPERVLTALGKLPEPV